MIKKGMIASAVLVLLMTGISLWAMGKLPAGELYATHWNAQGEANGYSGRGVVLWMMPAMALGMAALMAIIPSIDPRKRNLIRSSSFFLVTWVGTEIILLFAHLMMVLNATGDLALETISSGPAMVKWLSVLLAGFFAMLGAYMGKIRPNWFVGFRTPWTLSSDLSWDKTHRLVGRMFLVTGLATLIAAFALPSRWPLMILLGGTLSTALTGVIYSWMVWKNDPVRETLIPEEADEI
jgi:uncharacterized membrane protein